MSIDEWFDHYRPEIEKIKTKAEAKGLLTLAPTNEYEFLRLRNAFGGIGVIYCNLKGRLTFTGIIKDFR